MPIRIRMTVWYTALLALIVGGVGVFLVVQLRSDLTDGIDRKLRPAVAQIATGYQREGAQEFHDSSASLLAGDRAAAQVTTAGGRVVLTFGDAVAAAPLLGSGERATTLSGELRDRTVRPPGSAVAFRVAARSSLRSGRRVIVVAAQSLAPVDRSVHQVVVLLLVACPAALLLAAAGGWWLTRRALRPIEELTSAAQAITVGQVGERIAHPGSRDEVGRLATTLNTMLGRIRSGVDEQRRLVADASHELRTPLAAMRAELDVSLRLDDLAPAAREVLLSTRDEVDSLSRTVDNLLTLASADEGWASARSEAVDLRAVAADVAAALAPLADRRGIGIEVSGDPAFAPADAVLVRHAVRNVVDNAVKFSPAGGRVEVTVRADGANAELTVADQGPGVAPEHRTRIFERFFRVDAARGRSQGGSGLGLAIASEIARAHGGRLSVEPRDPRGSVFRLRLPLTVGPRLEK